MFCMAVKATPVTATLKAPLKNWLSLEQSHTCAHLSMSIIGQLIDITGGQKRKPTLSRTYTGHNGVDASLQIRRITRQRPVVAIVQTSAATYYHVDQSSADTIVTAAWTRLHPGK